MADLGPETRPRPYRFAHAPLLDGPRLVSNPNSTHFNRYLGVGWTLVAGGCWRLILA